MREFNLLENYPKLDQPRYVASNLRTIKERIIAGNREKDFFHVFYIDNCINLKIFN